MGPASHSSFQRLPQHHLIVGGQKSGKSRQAENLAQAWLQAQPQHSAVLIATAQAWDAEMQARITRHQQDRAQRLPGLRTVEEPLDLAAALQRHSQPDCLVVVDCLPLWLTNWTMPAAPGEKSSETDTENSEQKMPLAQAWQAQAALFMEALQHAPGPVVLVSNEIGLGVIPLGAQVRQFVDRLGLLHQQLAGLCHQVTLMVAGLPLPVKQ